MNRRDRAIVAGGAALLALLVAGFGVVTRAPGAVTASGAVTTAPASATYAAVAAAKSVANGADVLQPLSRYALLVDEAADRAWCDLPDDTLERMAEASAKVGSAPSSGPFLGVAPSASARQLAEGTEKLRLDWIGRLRARGDLRSRALADYLEAADDREGVCKHMVHQARGSADGFVHAVAWARCAAKPEGRDLDARQWARVDSGNQQPWFHELQRAEQSRDEQAADEALHQLSLAGRSENYRNEVMRLLRDFVQAPDAGLTQSAEASLIITFWAGWPTPSFKPLTRRCSAPLLDANRTQTCRAIADRLWGQGGDLMQLMIGLALAKRLTYTPEELLARQRELDELIEAAATVSEPEQKSASSMTGHCYAMENLRPWLDAVAEHGEAEALRRKRALKR